MKQKYQQAIQTIINENFINKDKDISPERIFLKLLAIRNKYTFHLVNQSNNKIFCNVENFSNRINKCDQPFNLLYELERFYQTDYQQIPGDAFHALCVTFFYYFKDLYPLKQYPSLYINFLKLKRIHYLQDKREKEFRLILSYLKHPDDAVVNSAILFLNNASIPDTLTTSVINKLFVLLSTLEKKIGISAPIATYRDDLPLSSKNIAFAFIVLAKIITPDMTMMIDRLVTHFIKKMPYWESNGEMFKILEKLPIPESHCLAVITQLQPLKFYGSEILASYEFIKKIARGDSVIEITQATNNHVIDFLKRQSFSANTFLDLLKTIIPSLISSKNAKLLLNKMLALEINLYGQFPMTKNPDGEFFAYMPYFYKLHEETLSTEQKNKFFDALIQKFKEMPAHDAMLLENYLRIFTEINLPPDKLSRVIDLLIIHYDKYHFYQFNHVIHLFKRQKVSNDEQIQKLFDLAIEKIRAREKHDAQQSVGYALLADMKSQFQIPAAKKEIIINLAIEEINEIKGYHALNRNHYAAIEFISSINIPPHLNNKIFICIFDKLCDVLKEIHKANMSADQFANSSISVYVNFIFYSLCNFRVPKDYIPISIILIFREVSQFVNLQKHFPALISLFNIKTSEPDEDIIFNELFSIYKKALSDGRSLQFDKLVTLPFIARKTAEIEKFLFEKIPVLDNVEALQNLLAALYQLQVTKPLQASIFMQIKLEALLSQVSEKCRPYVIACIHELASLNQAKVKVNAKEIPKTIIDCHIKNYLAHKP